MSHSRVLALGIGLTVLITSAECWAKGDGQDGGLVSVSGGIASPVGSTAVFENPAGIASVKRLELLATAGFPAAVGDDGTYGLGLNYGKPGFGLAGGALYSPTPKVSQAYFGLGVEASSLKTSIGISGRTPISPTGNSAFNLGVLIEPAASFQFGFTAINVGNSVDEFGFGLSTAIASEAVFVTDLTLDQHLKNPVLAPGIRVGGGEAQLSVSYGFKLSSNDPFSSQQIAEGISLGGGLKLGNSVSWEIYYHKFSKYFTALAFAL